MSLLENVFQMPNVMSDIFFAGSIEVISLHLSLKYFMNIFTFTFRLD